MPNIGKMAKKIMVAGDAPPLDRHRADEILEPDADLWGLKAIAACLGVSEKTASRWANDPACGLPVGKPMGRWHGRRNALLGWRRSR